MKAWKEKMKKKYFKENKQSYGECFENAQKVKM
jgi:hypothetical protein